MTQNKYNKGDQVQVANGDWFIYDGFFETGSLQYAVVYHGEKTGSNTMGVQVDLITDHRPAFDCKKTCSGMCFTDNEGKKWFCVGSEPEFKKTFVFVSQDEELNFFVGSDNGTFYSTETTTQLTRHPQGDICEANEIPEGDISSKTEV